MFSKSQVSLLDQTCDSSVNLVCATNSACCSTSWDLTCVDLAYQECGMLACETGSYAHGPCVTGAAQVPGCDNPPVSPICVQQICNLDAFFCDCVTGVESICGLTCD